MKNKDNCGWVLLCDSEPLQSYKLGYVNILGDIRAVHPQAQITKLAFLFASAPDIQEKGNLHVFQSIFVPSQSPAHSVCLSYKSSALWCIKEFNIFATQNNFIYNINWKETIFSRSFTYQTVSAWKIKYSVCVIKFGHIYFENYFEILMLIKNK